MGWFVNLLRALGVLRRPARLIVVGLDGAGKSCMINQLKPTRAASFEVTPTVGFSAERFERGGFSFQVFDMAGGGTYRYLWETYYRDVDAVIFVVDSSDKLRMCVARDEMEALLGHADMRSRGTVPILFLRTSRTSPAR